MRPNKDKPHIKLAKARGVHGYKWSCRRGWFLGLGDTPAEAYKNLLLK